MKKGEERKTGGRETRRDTIAIVRQMMMGPVTGSGREAGEQCMS